MRFKYRTVIIFLGVCLYVCLSTGAIFWRILFKHPKKVAAFSPCSSFVAREISSIIEHKNTPLRILEVGGGTGALTSEIIKQMQNGDICDVIEIIPSYCKVLIEQFGTRPGVNICCCSILDWNPSYLYDIIICSLPFNTFEPEFVDTILSHLKTIIKSHGKMSYVELLWISEWKKYFISLNSRKKLIETLTKMKKFRSTYGKKTVHIYWNITPIAVHHLEITK